MAKEKTVLIVLICLVSAGAFLFSYQKDNTPDMIWDMVNVNYSEQQGDAHLIRVKDGKTILIDVGHWNSAEGSLLKFLRDRSVTHVDTVFISHPHVDHYGGLGVLLDNGIDISEVYFNTPDKGICDQEIPWGCNYNEILALQKRLRDSGVDVRSAKAKDRYGLGKETWLEIVYAFDGVNTPVGKTDVNDLSLIMMLHHKQHTFLFTGDLNWKIGGYLSGLADNLSADILKVPHHGTETTAPDAFFDTVSPRYALVPAPEHLWKSDRSVRIRKWFSGRKIPVYVNGIAGDVRVTVTGGELKITSGGNDVQR